MSIKDCNIDTLDGVAALMEQDQTAKSLMDRVNFANMWVRVMEDNAWMKFIAENESQSAYNVLKSYTRYKMLANGVDKNRFITGLVDRIRNFGYDSVPYWDFWSYLDELEWFSDEALQGAGLTKKTIEWWRNGIAVSVINDFEYASETADILKTMSSNDMKIKDIETKITSKNFRKQLNNRFKLWSDKHNTGKWYSEWLTKLFSKLIWTSNSTITDWMIKKLISYWAEFDTFADIMAIRYITSWKASFTTFMKIIENPNILSSLAPLEWEDASNPIWDIRNTDWYETRKQKAFAYLRSIKENKSFNFDKEALTKSLMVDFANLSTTEDFTEITKKAIAWAERYDWDLTGAYIKHLNWEEVLNIEWNAVNFNTYPPHYYFWMWDDVFLSLFPMDETLLSNFGIKYGEIRDEFLINLIKDKNINSYKSLVSHLKVNWTELYKNITDKINEVSWANPVWDWLLWIASNANGTVINTTGKRIIVVADNEFFTSARWERRGAIEAMELWYEKNKLPTWIKTDSYTSTVVSFVNDITEAKVSKWDIIIQQDRWQDIAKKIYEASAEKWATIIQPQQWLRFSVEDWELVINFADGKRADDIFWKLWDLLPIFADNTIGAKFIRQLTNLLAREARVDNNMTTIVIEKWTENLQYKAFKTLNNLTQISVVDATPQEVLNIAKKMLENPSQLENIKTYIQQYISSDDIKYIQWDNLTREDIAVLMTTDNATWLQEVISKILDKPWIYPNVSITDHRNFWDMFLSRDKRLFISNVWDWKVLATFLDFIRNNTAILDEVMNKLKLADNEITNLMRNNPALYRLPNTVETYIQEAIDWISKLEPKNKEVIINFVNLLLWDWTAKNNKIGYKFARTAWVSDAKIATLWWAIEYYRWVVDKIKKQWVALEKYENTFIDRWDVIFPDDELFGYIDMPVEWEELIKNDQKLFGGWILGRWDAIPRFVDDAQVHWNNYWQYDEIEAEKIYTRKDNGYFYDNWKPVLDKNWHQLEDTYDDSGEVVLATISNSKLKEDLINSFETKEWEQYLKKVIDALPKDENWKILAYRIGNIDSDWLPQSYTLSEWLAKTFSNQWTDIPPAWLPWLVKSYDNFWELPANIVKIDPKGIVARSPYDQEILVTSKYTDSITGVDSLIKDNSITSEVKIPDSVSTADVPAPMTTNYKAGTLEYLNWYIADIEENISKQQAIIDDIESKASKTDSENSNLDTMRSILQSNKDDLKSANYSKSILENSDDAITKDEIEFILKDWDVDIPEWKDINIDKPAINTPPVVEKAPDVKKLTKEEKVIAKQEREIERALAKQEREIEKDIKIGSKEQRKLSNERETAREYNFFNTPRRYNINWDFIDKARWVDYMKEKNIRKWIASTIIDNNYKFGSDVIAWVKKFYPVGKKKAIDSIISRFTNKINKKWLSDIDMQYAIYELNKAIWIVFKDIASDYWDLIKIIWQWDNTFNKLFFEWNSIPVNTPRKLLEEAVVELQTNINNNIGDIARELSKRADSKDIAWTINNILKHRYTSVADISEDWTKFATIRIEDWIEELIELNRLTPEIKDRYDILKSTDMSTLKMEDQQKLFAYLYSLHFWHKMLNTLDSFLGNIAPEVWEIARKLITDYKVVSRGWVHLPSIFFNHPLSIQLVDTQIASRLFSIVKNGFEEWLSSATLSSLLNDNIAQFYAGQTTDVIDWIKQLYSIYPKLIENKTTKDLVLGNYIEWLDKIAQNTKESIRSFKTYKNILQSYAPDVKIWVQNVYTIWDVTDIKVNSFIPKFSTQQRYTSSVDNVLDDILQKKSKEDDIKDLRATQC